MKYLLKCIWVGFYEGVLGTLALVIFLAILFAPFILEDLTGHSAYLYLYIIYFAALLFAAGDETLRGK